MKALLAVMAVLFASSVSASPLVICVSGCPEQRLRVEAADATAPVPADTQLTPRLWLGPSLGLDVFTRDSSDNSYQLGARPAVGWGLKYRPNWWTATSALLALDLFASAGLSAQSFDTDLLPVLTVMDWVSFGVGYRYHFATVAGMHDHGAMLTSFGLRKAWGTP